MSKSLTKSIITLAVIFSLIGSFSYGVITKSELEEDARETQNIDKNWKYSQSVTDKIGAIIFYDGALENYRFSIYLNKPGVSFGYIYRDGGQLNEISAGIAAFGYPGMGTALISMNKVGAVRVELTEDKEKGELIQGWDLDAEKPFAVVVPLIENSGKELYLSIYNQEGKSLSSASFVNGEV